MFLPENFLRKYLKEIKRLQFYGACEICKQREARSFVQLSMVAKQGCAVAVKFRTNKIFS